MGTLFVWSPSGTWRALATTATLMLLILLAGDCSAAPVDPTDKDSFTYFARVKRKSPKACGEASDDSVRAVIPGVLSDEEIDWLNTIVQRGMSGVEDQRGPTIMDPDLGLVLARGGKVRRVEEKFTVDELNRYGNLLKRVYDRITKLHGLGKNKLFHTSPTFIARIAPFPAEMKTQHIHDECKTSSPLLFRTNRATNDDENL